MAGKDREIPWCTIILVAGALTCHTLVLMGNLETSAMFNRIGHSTKGWSHVGQHLGSSLGEELDVLMANTTTRLTEVISKLLEVKSGLDTALSVIGEGTDATLAQVKSRTSAKALERVALLAAASEGWPGPRARSPAILARGDLKPLTAPSLPPKANGSGAALVAEDEAVWLMETFRVNPPRLSALNARRAAPSEPNSSVFDGLKFPIESDADRDADIEVLKWIAQHPAEAMPALNEWLKDKANYDRANQIYKDSAKEATEWAVNHIDETVNSVMGTVNEKLDSFLEKIKPALLQVGKWLQSFGTKVQTTIEGFSTTLDKVQKIFDQLMAKMAQSKGMDKMLHDTYNLFDASHTGTISFDDLKEVGEVYGIKALAGDKAKGLLTKYDADKSGSLDEQEYALFVKDPAIPGAMAVVLRAYSKKLAQISGNVAAAKKRDEVASAVVAYLELVCTKNMTKVGWVSQTLTNGSLPMAFTADILKNMAMDVDNPAKLFSVEPGPILVGKMVELNHAYVTKTLEMMSDPQFWASEGFKASDQPVAVERVTKWIADAVKKTKLISPASGRVHAQLYALFLGDAGEVARAAGGAGSDAALLEAMPAMAAQRVRERSARHMATQRAYRAQAHAKLFSSRSSRVLFTELYGGATAGSTVEDPEATAAVNSGVPAKPETLKFAQYLSWNGSATAKRFQDQCFAYMGDSSSTLDSFATQIQAMIKKTQNFLNMMQQYSTPSGIASLEKMLKDFVNKAETKVKTVIRDKIYVAEKFVDKHSDLPHEFDVQLAQTLAVTGSQADEDDAGPNEVFMKVKSTLDQLQAILPEVIDDLKFARKEVSAVSKQLHSIFNTFEAKGPPIFGSVAELYATLWKAYYALFATITVGMLFYGFWATGWLGNSAPAEAAEDEGYQAPTGFMARCRMCCSACTTCMTACHDNVMCFWSCIILCEVIVLLVFIIAIVLTLVSGIKAFMGAGCSSIYFLADPSICSGILSMVKGWLGTFWEGAATALDDACHSESLLTCMLIEDKLMKSVMYTTAGSMAAAVLSFQMIVNTAQLHEQAMWVRIVRGLTKEV